MNAYEVTKALMEGKKVRDVDWIKDRYIYLKNANTIIDDEGNESVALLRLFDREWEIYDERKDIPEQFDWLKSFSDMHTTGKCKFDIKEGCNKCPLSEQTQVTQWSICTTISGMAKELNKKYKL